MKKLTNLNGVKTLSKNEQKTINGGSNTCNGIPTFGFCCTRCTNQDPCLICIN